MQRVRVEICVAMLALAACSGKKRDFADGVVLPSTAGTAADASARAELVGSTGSACSTAAECSSGNCVDGVCCRTSCDVVCSRCDAPGSEGECTATANDDACGLSCPDSTECRTYGAADTGANCEAPGLCRANVECAPTDAPLGTACRQGAGACDGAGECVVPGARRLGEACQGDADCGQGHCIVGSTGVALCCDSACDGLCRTCDATGRCDEPATSDARCGSVDCPADDACRDYPEDILDGSCRAFGTCRTIADCSPTELRPAAECACGEGGCTLVLGAACSANEQCASGACEPTASGAQICCAMACAAAGSTCASSGSGCVDCEGTGTECVGSVSRSCTNGAVDEQVCGNGCNPETGLCAELRPTGTVCEVTEQCASGACSIDLTGTNRCCDPACAAAGRVCGTDGTCVCAATQQEVAGVCLASNGAACAVATDCASGTCVPTLAGASVCCATACTNASCSADGSACVQCEGAGSECIGNTSRRCENNQFVETTCGNGCVPTTGVCAGLLANGQGCTATAQCASNACELDVAGAQRCCTPGCAATGRVCGVDGACVCPDPNDTFLAGQCRAPVGQGCAAAGDCSTGACESTQSGGLVCCTAPCNGQICRANGQGCVQCEGGGPVCEGASSRSCVNNAFVSTPCANGCNPATGMCNALLPLGSNGCAQDVQCAGAGASCQGGRCCEFDCAAAGRTCNASGVCACPDGTTAFGAACLIADGQPCDLARPEQCASSQCLEWFRDRDGDLHGDPNDSVAQCGTVARSGFVTSRDDCCDRADTTEIREIAATIFGGQAAFFATAQTACLDVPAFDFNCDSLETKEPRPVGDCSEDVCRTGLSPSSADAACGAAASFLACFRPSLLDGTIQRCQGTGGMDRPISCH